MITLCQHRPEGFGPHSSLHPRLPTTCFLDVIVEPLPTWIFLALLLALLPVRLSGLRRQRRVRPSFSFNPDAQRKSESGSAAHRGVLSRALAVLYYLLIIAMVAMVSLELARLVAAELGIGLLPFTYVGVLAAVATRLTWRSRTAVLVNVLYWVMLAAAMALKTAAEQEEQMGPDARVKNVTTQGMYPSSDEVIDNAVMVGVEVLLAVLEFVGWRALEW